jgi:redox-sensitive bicupin YhaK (pirin superfamily)
VTWLLAGEMVHRDSLGSEQTIRPGQLNLMTAGAGISHAEEPTTTTSGRLHGIQLWVAQPERTRHGPPSFEHHGTLPRRELEEGVATVLVGSLGEVRSPARRDSDLVGLDVALRRGRSTVPLDPAFEYGVVVLEGRVEVDGQSVGPGVLAYGAPGAEELDLVASDDARLMVLGGTPFESPLVMWWNFVGRSRSEMVSAAEEWNAGSDRFGETGSHLARIPAPATPWGRSASS